jgi:hypothetical protein
MAKIKPAGKKKRKQKSNLQAIPCVLMILSGLILLALLFYALLQSSSS